MWWLAELYTIAQIAQCSLPPTVEARKLEHGTPTPNQSKKENQHKSRYIHASTFWGPTVEQQSNEKCGREIG